MKPYRSTFTLVASTLALACGDSMTSEVAPLVELHGVVENQAAVQLTNPAAFRVAAVWNGDNRKYSIADLPVSPVFPSSFTLGLMSPPPASFEMEGDIARGPTEVLAHFYAAEVFAYEDAGPSGWDGWNTADRPVGLARRIRLLYLSRADELPRWQALFPSARLGFNIFVATGANSPETCVIVQGMPCDEEAIIPLDSTVVVQLMDPVKFE